MSGSSKNSVVLCIVTDVLLFYLVITCIFNGNLLLKIIYPQWVGLSSHWLPSAVLPSSGSASHLLKNGMLVRSGILMARNSPLGSHCCSVPSFLSGTMKLPWRLDHGVGGSRPDCELPFDFKHFRPHESRLSPSRPHPKTSLRSLCWCWDQNLFPLIIHTSYNP